MFQTITAFELKLRLWQNQAKENNYVHLPALVKYIMMNNRIYASFQDFCKNN